MPTFFTLSCPTCGAKLQIENNLQRFACAFCGNEHIVNREGGVISLFPALNGVERIQAGIDRTAIELIIARLDREIKAGRHEAPTEIDEIKEHYTVYPEEPVCEWKCFWQEAAFYIQQRRNPNHRGSVFGKILNVWDGGISDKDANNVLRSLTLTEIDNLLQWLSSPNFSGRNDLSYTNLVEDIQRLKALEELITSVTDNEAELKALRQLLKS